MSNPQDRLNKEQLADLLSSLGAVKKNGAWSCIFCGGESCVNVLEGSGEGAVAYCHRHDSDDCQHAYGSIVLRKKGLFSDSYAPPAPRHATAKRKGWLDFPRLWNQTPRDFGRSHGINYFTRRGWSAEEAGLAIDAAQRLHDLIGQCPKAAGLHEINIGAAPEWALIPSQCHFQRANPNEAAWAFMSPIRDSGGVIHSAEKRRHHSDPKKCKTALPAALLSEPAPSGTLRVFGSIPNALSPDAPETLVIVEGLTDYITALGCSALSDRPFSVIGAQGAEQLPKIAWAIFEHHRGSPRRIVLVPDKDDHGKGQEKMEALRESLGPIFDIRIADVGEVKDLTDVVKAQNLRAALKCIESAPLFSKKGAEKGEIKAPSFPVLDHRGITAEIERFLRAASPQKLMGLDITTGGGKTYGTLETSAAFLSEGRTMVVAFATHKLIAEKSIEAEKLGIPQTKQHVLSAWRAEGACELLIDIEDQDGKARRDFVAQNFGRRGAPCHKCQFSKGCKASPQWRKKHGIKANKLNLVTHAALPHLDLPSDALLIIDEAPADLTGSYFSLTDLVSLTGATNSYALANPEIADIAHHIAEQAMQEARETLAKSPTASRAHGVNVKFKADDLRTSKNGLIVAKYDDYKNLPALPTEKDHRGWLTEPTGPSREAARMLVEFTQGSETFSVLASQIGKKLTTDDVRIRLNTRAPRPACATQFLDATATLRSAEHQARAAHWGLPLHIHRIDVQGQAAAVEWIQTTAFNRRSLLSGAGKKTRVLRRGVRALMQLIRGENRKRRLNNESGPVGIIAPKAVSQLLKALNTQDLATVLRDHCTPTTNAVDLQLLKSALEELNISKEELIGHWGADNRASNAFEDARHLILIGAPIPNVAATRADAEALGIDHAQLTHDRIAADVAQAIGRLRGVRQGGSVSLYAPKPGQSVPDFTQLITDACEWTVDASEKRGRPSNTEMRDYAKALADTFGGLASRWLVEAGAEKRTAERICALEGKERGWSAKDRPGAVWGAKSPESRAANIAYKKVSASIPKPKNQEKPNNITVCNIGGTVSQPESVVTQPETSFSGKSSFSAPLLSLEAQSQPSESPLGPQSLLSKLGVGGKTGAD